MAIEKSLYAAPQGLGAVSPEEPLEIEVVNPEEVNIGMDGMELSIRPEEDSEEGFDDNLAEYIPQRYLSTLVGDLLSDIDDDINSRKDWVQTYRSEEHTSELQSH